MPLKWKRPDSSEYPKIWHKFSVWGENYWIQDLPLSMTKDALQFLKEYFYVDESLATAYNLHENIFYVDYCELLYRRIVLKQKASFVCFKEGSNDIIGLNMNHVTTNEDQFDIEDVWLSVYSTCQQWYRLCTDNRYTLRAMRDANRNIKRYIDVIRLIQNGLSLDADRVLMGCGLCVAPKYRCRGVAVELLKTRKPFCKEFNIPLTYNAFTSDTSGRCAAKAGFKLDRRLSYDTIRKHRPDLIPVHTTGIALNHRSMWID